jgi:hypothetical protein
MPVHFALGDVFSEVKKMPHERAFASIHMTYKVGENPNEQKT